MVPCDVLCFSNDSTTGMEYTITSRGVALVGRLDTAPAELQKEGMLL